MATRRIKAALVGMRYYGATSGQAQRAIDAGAVLVREPDNPHDANAIALFAAGRKLGHVDKRNASLIAPMIDAGAASDVSSGETKNITELSVPIILTIRLSDANIDCPKICEGRVTGIYAIEVLPEQKAYFGQSLDVQGRVAGHWRDLSYGCHSNPELQQYWSDHGAAAFRPSLKEAAPGELENLALARWLVTKERHWIECSGGMRRVINAEWPAPVLNEIAKAKLYQERREASELLATLDGRIAQLEAEIGSAAATLSALRESVAASKKWWGIFTSDDVRERARLADKKRPSLEGEIAKLSAKRAEIQERLRAKKDYLFL